MVNSEKGCQVRNDSFPITPFTHFRCYHRLFKRLLSLRSVSPALRPQVHCRVTKSQTEDKNNRSQDSRSQVKQVRVAHYWMNPYSCSKTHQARETKHLPETSRSARAPDTEEDRNPGSADGAAKAGTVVSNQRHEASASSAGCKPMNSRSCGTNTRVMPTVTPSDRQESSLRPWPAGGLVQFHRLIPGDVDPRTDEKAQTRRW